MIERKNEDRKTITINWIPIVSIIGMIGVVLIALSLIGAIGNTCELEIEASAEGSFDFNVSPVSAMKELLLKGGLIKVRTELPCTHLWLVLGQIK